MISFDVTTRDLGIIPVLYERVADAVERAGKQALDHTARYAERMVKDYIYQGKVTPPTDPGSKLAAGLSSITMIATSSLVRGIEVSEPDPFRRLIGTPAKSVGGFPYPLLHEDPDLMGSDRTKRPWMQPNVEVVGARFYWNFCQALNRELEAMK